MGLNDEGSVDVLLPPDPRLWKGSSLHELLSKLLVSPLITPTVVPYFIFI